MDKQLIFDIKQELNKLNKSSMYEGYGLDRYGDTTNKQMYYNDDLHIFVSEDTEGITFTFNISGVEFTIDKTSSKCVLYYRQVNDSYLEVELQKFSSSLLPQILFCHNMFMDYHTAITKALNIK